ncbi:hypothetical protein VTN00DRAFT_5500 [Thermoascus crustaceus]|uniref:uncharacterized protein n=1 Tax=Thermoascus crustaceus TaxID=5088 RepID=UPI0037438502
MADIVEPEEHRARCAALRRLEKSVINLGAEFSSYGKPDLESCFFEPYPADLLMKPEEGYVATEFPEYDAPVPNNEIDARLIEQCT